MLRKLLLFLFFVLFLSVSYSQEPSFTLPSKEPVFSHQYTNYRSGIYHFIDTSFNSLRFYHQGNNTQKDLFYYSPLGNMGAPLNSLTTFSENNLWSYYDYRSFTPYFLNQNNIPFYYTTSPLTEATYWRGYDLGQLFSIYHTQNVNEHWNFLIKYKRLNSLGFYNNNRNKQASFLANTHYKNEETGYEAYAWFISEKMDVEEFGGIVNDSIFEENLESNRILYEVNLGSDLRVMQKREFFVDQKIGLDRLFSSFTPKDTVDSAVTNVSQNQFLSVGHSFQFTRKINLYNGAVGDAFYDNYFLDQENEYRDSSGYREYVNTFYIESKIGKESGLDLRAGLKNLITEYGGPNFQFITNNWGVVSDIRGFIRDRIKVSGKLDYILTGNLRESLLAQAKAELRFYKELHGFGGYQLSVKFPDFLDQFYYSNNFIWQNDFRRITANEIHFGARWKENTKLTITNQTYSNYLYFNAEALPTQTDEVVNVFKAELTQNFTFWDLIHWDNRVIYQNVGGNSGVLPLPEWVSRNALYFYFNRFFNLPLKCVIGAEVKYFPSYFSPSYMPATGAFYIANEKRIGDYPFIDVFANFKIKKARIYLKYEHVNEGLNGFSYFAAPNYPLPDRVFRIGISWRFFN